MAAAALDTRDLRSAHKEWKRSKDSRTKWSRGVRPLAGVHANFFGEPITGSPEQQAGMRPSKRSESRNPSKKPSHQPFQTHPNVIKPSPRYDMPISRVRSRIHCHTFTKPLPNPLLLLDHINPGTNEVSDPFLYSFDRRESPGGPLTLEVFVVQNGGKGRMKKGEAERLVEREYEVVDGRSGEAVRGGGRGGFEEGWRGPGRMRV
ncbi:hypothetical protein N0V88_003097 [Collariella sp. IMI 366227]|nr:hypothetical protein N0V88_003097 [Collariella sp. IMI 366227]